MSFSRTLLFSLVGLFSLPGTALAQSAEGTNPIISMIAIVALTLLPFAFMVTTSFVKISVVLSLLRNALGTGQIPSGAVITSLSAILSLYVMAPVGAQIADVAGPSAAGISVEEPLESDSVDALLEAIDRGKEPMRDFLRRHAGEREVELFFGLARESRGEDAEVSEDDLLVLLPAFLITELSEAFQIGFLIFIPFLVVDMVVANVLLALGMHMLSPTTVSLPFKLLLFVLVEGWYLLARALVLGYL